MIGPVPLWNVLGIIQQRHDDEEVEGNEARWPLCPSYAESQGQGAAIEAGDVGSSGPRGLTTVACTESRCVVSN